MFSLCACDIPPKQVCKQNIPGNATASIILVVELASLHLVTSRLSENVN